MSDYFSVEPNGRIAFAGSCEASQLAFQSYPGGEIIEGKADYKSQYWDGLKLVQKGDRPSPNHVFNYATKQWEDPRTLEDLKAAQWSQIKLARADAEYAGFTWDGSTFDSDATSQSRIAGAVTLAQMSADFMVDWILADNTTRTLGQAEMLQVGATLGGHVAAQFAHAQALRLEIAEATTRAEVETVVW